MSHPSTWQDVHVYDGKLKRKEGDVNDNQERKHKLDTSQHAVENVLTRMESKEAKHFAELILKDGHSPTNYDSTNNVYADDLFKEVAVEMWKTSNETHVEPVARIVFSALLMEAVEEHKQCADDSISCLPLLPDLGVWFSPTLLPIVSKQMEHINTKENLQTWKQNAIAFFNLNEFQSNCIVHEQDIRRLIECYVYIQEERHTDMIHTLEIALADIQLGSCPQGRCTRLSQIISCFDSHSQKQKQ